MSQLNLVRKNFFFEKKKQKTFARGGGGDRRDLAHGRLAAVLRGAARKPAVAVVTMAYNESANLPIWRDHYRRAVPHGELFVVDHGSDDGSATGLHGVSRIPLPRRTMDEIQRSRFVSLLQASLLQYYDYVIYTDCDELIVVEPELCLTLEDYLGTCGYDYAAPIGLNIQHIVDAEPDLRDGQPILSQRRICYFHSQMCKPLISRVRLKWEPGFHRCDLPLRVDSNLYLFHLKYADRERSMARQKLAKRVKWSRKAVEAQHGAHHRMEDQVYLEEFFRGPTRRFHRDGVKPFTFEAEVGRAQEPGSGEFLGPFVEIPARFGDAF
jgi:hypothetical protein